MSFASMGRGWIRWATAGALVACSTVACGANVVFDEEGTGGEASGGGGAESTSSGTTTVTTTVTTTGGDPCDPLREAFENALRAATECSLLEPVVQCDGSLILLDTCGCPAIVANEHHPDLAEAAKAAYDAWVAGGCGPYPCEQCLPAKNGGSCQADPQGKTGHCVPLTPF
jgi:hypothetical protein